VRIEPVDVARDWIFTCLRPFERASSARRLPKRARRARDAPWDLFHPSAQKQFSRMGSTKWSRGATRDATWPANTWAMWTAITQSAVQARRSKSTRASSTGACCLKRQNRATIAAGVRRFGHVINMDGVLGTHRTLSCSPAVSRPYNSRPCHQVARLTWHTTGHRAAATSRSSW
jgi:hypothetical protein